MKLFLDSGDLREIGKWINYVDGITTNPSILKKDGFSIDEILNYVPDEFPISLEVGFPYEEEARELGSRIGVSVKIPLLNPDRSNNLDLIKSLAEDGLLINCTALFSLGQVILASRTGARYVSVFGGRIDDEGGNSFDVVKQCCDYLFDSNEGSNQELIVGSIRSVSQISDYMEAGADIVTIPPAILEKMLMHNFSVETSKQFQKDWELRKK